ncbi:hypothetical protein [Streptomyces sp. XH2]|uniref:hypothetical protein n=1 Tax=Streptomyces sp. XH2 TaxID=3412483 RepID=UPI003C7CED5F
MGTYDFDTPEEEIAFLEREIVRYQHMRNITSHEDPTTRGYAQDRIDQLHHRIKECEDEIALRDDGTPLLTRAAFILGASLAMLVGWWIGALWSWITFGILAALFVLAAL